MKIFVKVKPNSKHKKEPPVEGRANQTVMAALAKYFAVSQNIHDTLVITEKIIDAVNPQRPPRLCGETKPQRRRGHRVASLASP